MFRVPRSLGSVQRKYIIQKVNYSSRPGGNRKIFFLSGLAASAVGLSGLIVYGKYDPNFKKVVVDYVPLTKHLYQLFEPPDNKKFPGDDKKVSKKEKIGKMEAPNFINRAESGKLNPTIESQADSLGANKLKSVKSNISNTDASKAETQGTNEKFLESSKEKDESLSNEKLVLKLLEELEKTSHKTLEALNMAVKSISHHTEKLYEAVDLSEGNDDDLVCKEAKEAASKKEQALKRARESFNESKEMIQKVRESIKRLNSEDPNNNIIRTGTKSVDEFEMKLNQAESEVSAANAGAKTAADYEKLVKASQEQFEKELKIVLPKLVHYDRKTNMSEDDLNVLITHAHRRIEKLQKEIARLKIAEKSKIDEAVKNQKMQDEDNMEALISEELKKKNISLESAVENKVAQLKARLEANLHQQLLRQAAAHADHLKEALNVQARELERKHILDIEEKLLHEKGKFITEVSGNMLRIKGIMEFLKAKNEFEMSSMKCQALSLLCQALHDKIHPSLPGYGIKSSLSRDIAAIKVIAKESLFINNILNILPDEVVQNGVSSRDDLKHRFENVKSICKKVSLIDETNDSLFRYFLSYIQSFLVFDDYSGINEELKGLAAVDTKKFDTFDILNRISYCLAFNDFDQGLRYAHLLQGEAKSVAEGWIKEVTFLLEAELVVKALTAHVSALRVQAYH